ncbi:MAG: CoA transferase [Sphingobium sp.]|nr:MAG: CoA transferase [Sphingobium sp.]
MSGALSGLRVIEMVGLGPAPFAAMMLADHGAEVIRIHAKGQRPDFPLLNGRFDVLGRNRRSLMIDLRAEGGADLLLDLVGQADGLIEGFRPGVMERLGLGPETCLARNPALAYGRMTGWGQDGPMALQAGHDMNYLGLTGGLNAIGPADRPPIVPLNYVADFGGGGMLLAFGLIAAILSAKRTGQGQVIDAAMVDGASLLASMFWGFRAGGAWSDRREANLLDGGAYFYTTYACSDGRFLAVACVEKRFHDILLERLGLDPAVFTHVRDPSAWPGLRDRLAALLATQPRDHWAALFEGSDACVSPVLGWDEAASHPQAVAREAFVSVEGVTQPAPAPRFTATPARAPTTAVAPGRHSRAVLEDWGIDPARVAAAFDSGMIAQGSDL